MKVWWCRMYIYKCSKLCHLKKIKECFHHIKNDLNMLMQIVLLRIIGILWGETYSLWLQFINYIFHQLLFIVKFLLWNVCKHRCTEKTLNWFKLYCIQTPGEGEKLKNTKLTLIRIQQTIANTTCSIILKVYNKQLYVLSWTYSNSYNKT
jgi:hypothetical protein